MRQPKWHNLGDRNPRDHGGLFISQDGENSYHVVQVENLNQDFELPRDRYRFTSGYVKLGPDEWYVRHLPDLLASNGWTREEWDALPDMIKVYDLWHYFGAREFHGSTEVRTDFYRTLREYGIFRWKDGVS